MLEQHLAVNLFGPYAMTAAFLPLLTRAGGAIVNNLSMLALAPPPVTPAYAVSKAAASNLTQSLRALLAPRGVSVRAVLTGPTDTNLTRGLRMKASPESVARAMVDGVECGEEDISPTPHLLHWRISGGRARPRRWSASTRPRTERCRIR